MEYFSRLKLEIFIPESALSALRTALQSVDAGHIGNYDCCMSYSPVIGTWRSLAGAKPYVGSAGQISNEIELKVEVVIDIQRYDETIKAIRRVHPYEEPVINAIPLWNLSKKGDVMAFNG